MPWTLVQTKENPDSALAAWEGFVLDLSVSGTIVFGLGYEADELIRLSWARHAHVLTAVFLDNLVLTSDTETAVFRRETGGVQLHSLDYRWTAQYNGFGGKNPAFLAYFHPMPYLPPGRFQLWRLT